jgi:methionyl-tRNA synthetase/aminoacyl tRNA synthase complex-interacting multifunctional protein 1
MEGRLVLVLCTEEHANWLDFSHGMVLCASNADHGRQDGERSSRGQGWRARDCSDMNFEGEEGAPYAENKIGKKKRSLKI